MTKNDIVTTLSQQHSIPKARIQRILDGFLREVSDAVTDGDAVELRGFGTFFLKEQKSTVVRDFAKGEHYRIPKRYAPAFRPSANWRERTALRTQAKANEEKPHA